MAAFILEVRPWDPRGQGSFKERKRLYRVLDWKRIPNSIGETVVIVTDHCKVVDIATYTGLLDETEPQIVVSINMFVENYDDLAKLDVWTDHRPTAFEKLRERLQET